MKNHSKSERLFAKSLARRLFVAAAALTILWADFAPAQETGVTDAEIVLGQSCALKGPTRLLGLGMQRGALTYFEHINGQGGINGRKIRLVSYDDGYEPDACVANTNKLIDQDKVFLLFGYVGTPTSKAAVPVATAKATPYFAPFTGAEFLRHPVNRFVFNIRASYYQETEAMVEKLVSERKIKRISVFYQNDSYGEAGLEGARLALERRGMVILNKAHYPRNTVEVEAAVDTILAVSPQAVIMIGAYEPCAKFVRLMREKGSEAVFLNVSFVGANQLGNILLNEGAGVVITQVVPFPYHRRLPVVVEYKERLKARFPKVDPGFVSMEGYIAAKALCEILAQVPEPLTRDAFIQTAETMEETDLGGFKFSFGPTSHQGSDEVYFTQVAPGGFVNPVDSLRHLY